MEPMEAFLSMRGTCSSDGSFRFSSGLGRLKCAGEKLFSSAEPAEA